MMLGKQKNTYDIIIIGSGLAGAILAMILAKNNLSVLVIDSSVHPRFAVGESTIPQTSQLLSLLSKEYDIPELHEIGLKSPDGIRKLIGDVCGVKRTFGFAYHNVNQEHDPKEAIQFGNVWRDENHLFRQDIDAYLSRLAVSYGAVLLQNTIITSVDIDDDAVKVTTKDNKVFHAKYIIDGSGHKSILADMYKLREEPTHFKHHSRSIFTHLIDVEPFENCVTNHLSVKWSMATLHQVFERGWFWIIPFNNYPGSKNPLVSVGLTIDPRRYPDTGMGAEEEFCAFLDMFPSVRKQFINAKAVRPWVKTGRLQYSSKKSIGKRFCLLSHASAFIDPLFSRGLINSLEIISLVVKTLVKAFQDNDFSIERFNEIDTIQTKILNYADRLANGSFISWSNFDVWNAWLRVWATGVGGAESNLGSYLLMGNHSNWRPVSDFIFSPFEQAEYKPYFEKSEDIILRYEAGELPAQETSKALFDILNNFNFKMALPIEDVNAEWALKNPNSRDFFLGTKSLHERWARRENDPHLSVLEKA